MLHRLEQTVGEQTLNLGTPLLLTISGGADSVALLHIAVRLGIDIVAAHCNFHLRGEESNRDEMFVKDLCSSLQVRLHTKDFNVDTYCKEHGASVEMACRDLRYAWFRELKTELQASRIVTAHNADDNIETLLLNLFRGTGIDGLRGMVADNGEILRPLLYTTRAEIEEYLNEIGATHITDSTNLSSDYQRNFIRNELLPAIESRWHGIRKTILRTQRNLAGVNAFYRSKVEELLAGSRNFISYEVLVAAPDRRTLIFEFLKPYGASSVIIDEIERSLSDNPISGKQWILKKHRVVAERQGLRIVGLETICNHELQAETLTCTPVTIAQIKRNKDHAIAYFPGTVDDYELRPWQRGDRIAPLGMSGSRLVSDIISDAKLNAEQKQRLSVLVERRSGKIVWVPGLKRSRHCLVTPDDSHVIKLTLKQSLFPKQAHHIVK